MPAVGPAERSSKLRKHSLRQALGYLAMASALDSQAHFEERLEAMGLSDLLEAFRKKGWNTLGNFAFAIPPVAQADDALFQAKVLQPLLGAVDDPRESSVRRLHFEAHTVAVADVRRPLIISVRSCCRQRRGGEQIAPKPGRVVMQVPRDSMCR